MAKAISIPQRAVRFALEGDLFGDAINGYLTFFPGRNLNLYHQLMGETDDWFPGIGNGSMIDAVAVGTICRSNTDTTIFDMDKVSAIGSRNGNVSGAL